MSNRQSNRPARLFAAATFFFAASASAGPVISIQPAANPVLSGASFSVDVTVTGIADLYAFQFDIGFDPTILSATQVTEGAFLPSGGSTFFLAPSIDNGAGQILGTADSLLTAISGVSGDGVLATIQFQAVGAGTSGINILNGIFLDSQLAGIAATSQNGAATVSLSSAPEPAPGVLTGLALVGVAAFMGRRRPRGASGRRAVS